jgi:hypothetical protein
LQKQFLFASETNTFYIYYVESKNEFRAKKNPSVTQRCQRRRPVVGRNWYRRYLSRLKGYSFGISAIHR